MRRIGRLTALVAIIAPQALASQGASQAGAAAPRTLSPGFRQYVAVDAPVVAIVHAKLIDGTGTPAKNDQTILIRGEKIATVGPSSSVTVPAGAQVVDASGKSVIPGIIGLHD